MAEPNDDADRQSTADEAAEPSAPEPTDAPAKGAAKADTQVIKDRNRRIREEAAAKRRQKRVVEDRRVAPARNLDTSELVDDAMARTTHAVAQFLRRNFNVVQYIVLAAVVGGIGYQIYDYRHSRSVARAADELEKGVRAEHARVGDASEPTGPDRYNRLSDTRANYPTDEARLKAAETEYKKVIADGSATTSALASLALAGIYFDQGKYKDAQAAYEKVKTSPLAKIDPDARARAIEGVGLSLEAAGQIDDALKAFRELENADISGFAPLGQYHQARLLAQKGQRSEAKALLEKALKKLSEKSDDSRAPQIGAGSGFLQRQARDLMNTIDPSAAPKTTGKGMDPEELERLQSALQGANGKIDPQKLQELLKKMGAGKGPGGPVSVPAAPVDAPESPAPVETPNPAGSAP